MQEGAVVLVLADLRARDLLEFVDECLACAEPRCVAHVADSRFDVPVYDGARTDVVHGGGRGRDRFVGLRTFECCDTVSQLVPP